ncbi:unnamed protein product, partial [Rotaria sp. Silwood2]
RPTAEVLEWLRELFDLLNSNAGFRGDGRSLSSIGEELGIDETNLITVAARTPQKSALKLFRLLYPTIGLRASCISISKLPEEQLQNIYRDSSLSSASSSSPLGSQSYEVASFAFNAISIVSITSCIFSFLSSGSKFSSFCN